MAMTRDEVFVHLGRALREFLPDVAEQRLRELERASATIPVLEAVRGARGDDAAVAMNAIERSTPGGPRGLWTVVANPAAGGALDVRVQVEASPESTMRQLDELLVPARDLLPPEVKEGLAAASPALEAILEISRRGQSPPTLADVISSAVLQRVRKPAPDPALPDAEAALRHAFPERAAEILAALSRMLPQCAPVLARARQSRIASAADALALAEAAAAAATGVEDAQKGGARFRWTARARGVAVEILREPV